MDRRCFFLLASSWVVAPQIVAAATRAIWSAAVALPLNRFCLNLCGAVAAFGL